MRFPSALQNLIDKLAGLPSVGPKTAERFAFYLLKKNSSELESLAEAIRSLKEKTDRCHLCLAVSDGNPCAICLDPNRLTDTICLVEDIRDLNAIESTGGYKGKYFVLGGLLDTIKEIRPEDLPFDQLIKRLKAEKIQELILALNFTLEGETTALYLTRLLKGQIKITRLAKGLPAGSDLEYADELTLASALKNRNEAK